jgi:hypothetical protein
MTWDARLLLHPDCLLGRLGIEPVAVYYYLELITEDSAMAQSRAAFPMPARIRPDA